LQQAKKEIYYGCILQQAKKEIYYGCKWSGILPEKLMQHAYIRWYNERRIKLSLGTVSLEMYRQAILSGIRKWSVPCLTRYVH
ncbi:IS3 family transposase, partial [Salmonella enterica]|uniref:IS3 family transposase n=1 Tax=Salmonella enterica TaxID=28901 RepID=UPI002245A6E4